MSVTLTKFYWQKTFEPGQIQDAFKKLPIYLKAALEYCSLSANYKYSNGINQNKEIDWKDLDTICEINVDSLSSLLFSYHPRGSGSTIIYIESQSPEQLYIHCDSPELNTTNNLVSTMEDSLSLKEIKKGSDPLSKALSKNEFNIVEKICSRFDLVVRQLKSRHSNRAPVLIEDEYDTQDLLHALLHIHFDDIRPEEWTPSYAGGSSRIDFLLKKEQIIIEVKKTRETLKAKQIGDELLIDIQRYQSHPDCKYLICFVYDPEGLIKNPRGLENDLNQEHDTFSVKTIVVPKGY